MLLQRCQKGIVKNCRDFRTFHGQYGNGVYAMKRGDRPMERYYTSNGESVYYFEIKNKYIVNLTRKHLDYWGVQEFIYNNPQYKAFILKHKGIGIPTSQQILITDPTIIENIFGNLI
jgi:hypothetical protein